MTPGLGRNTAAVPLSSALRRLAPALLAAAFLAACGGGGGSSAPGDTAAPTVVITPGTLAPIASGDVTFTFTFSEDVGTSFTASDVTVTGGTKGVFTKVSGTVTTMVVVPTANTLGTINVSVGPGAFTDLAGNPNTGTAGASKAYDTRVPLTQMSLPVSFDSATVAYGLLGFGGVDGSVDVDPTTNSNKVGKVVKSATAETWGGATLTADGTLGFSSKVPFDASNTRITVRTYSPDAGIQVRLKVEDHTNGSVSVETEATTTTANAWETLTFDFAHQAAGTAALDLAKTYDKASIFFNFNVSGATVGAAKTYWFDDVTFIGGGGTGGGPVAFSTITFDDAAKTYTLTGFGGADDSTVVADPTNAANKVAKVVKSATAELWAGTTASTGAAQSAGRIPLDAANTVMSVKVWSPDAGIPVRLKVENSADPTVTCETEATVVTAGAWATLSFNFANQAAGTAALNPAATYDKVSVFFNFGTTGAVAGAKTYYFDDVTFVGGTGGGGGGGTAPATLPPVPTKAAGAEVYALHSSVTGGYAGTVSDQSSKVDTWLTGWSAGTGGTTTAITAAGGSASPRTYTFTNAAPFVGIEFIGTPVGANEIDAAALGLDTLHVDVWTPDNASNFQVKLVDFGADGAFGGGDDSEGIATLTPGSTPPLATGTWLSYDLKLATAFPGLSNLHHLAQMVLVAPNGGTMYLDNIYFYKGAAAPPPAAPTVAPASPTALQADVISLLSAVYADRTVDTWSTVWDQATLTELTIGGVPVKEYGPLAFAGIEFIGAAGANEIDATGMTHFHVDVWTPDITNFQVKLVDFGADAAFAGGDDTDALFTAHAGTTPALTGTQQWVSLDIPLSSFVPSGASWNRAHLAQLLFISGTGTGTAYVTNVYFHK